MVKSLSIKIAVLVLIANIFSCERDVKSVKRPNILFAIANDASWKHFGAYACEWVNTPSFDKVANQGILFSSAYTPNTTSSRSCILTGKNSWQLEEECTNSSYFSAKFKTYFEILAQNNYWVGSVAKGWGSGESGLINGKSRELTGPKFDVHKLVLPSKYISDNDYSKNFEEFLKAKPSDQPFCFWYGIKEPHRAYEYSSAINKANKKIIGIDRVSEFCPDLDSICTDMLDYALEIEYFDSHLGKMLNKLKEIGELENTIVVVTAHNGMPFPRIKGQVYEYSNHVPLAIMWPKGIKNPGRVVDDFVNFIDFAPTFLDVAGLSGQNSGIKTSGKSLNDIFCSEKSGKVTKYRDFVLVGKECHDAKCHSGQGYPVRGIVKGDFLYNRNFKTNSWFVGNTKTAFLNCDVSLTKNSILDIRRKKGELKYWQINFAKCVSEELYNIKKDPCCIDNLAANKDFLELKNRMISEMENHLKEQNDPIILGNLSCQSNY